MSTPKPKPCPECGSDDLSVDSNKDCGSWVDCNCCDFRFLRACSEDAVIRQWNKLPRDDRSTAK